MKFTSSGLRIVIGKGAFGFGVGVGVGVQLKSCFGFGLGCGRRSGRVSGLGQKKLHFFLQLTSSGLYGGCMVVEDARGMVEGGESEGRGMEEGGESKGRVREGG